LLTGVDDGEYLWPTFRLRGHRAENRNMEPLTTIIINIREQALLPFSLPTERRILAAGTTRLRGWTTSPWWWSRS